MSDESIVLTEAEWEVMEFLWENPGAIGRAICECMSAKKGWSRSTTLTLLTRLEKKGAVSSGNGSIKAYSPLISRADASLRETKNLLDRFYNGSLGVMVSAFTKKQKLSREEIDEMYALLRELEEKNND